jgi:hypothetical protein
MPVALVEPELPAVPANVVTGKSPVVPTFLMVNHAASVTYK